MLWLTAELPPDIPAECVATAADHYSVPTELLVAVVRQEKGKVGKAYPRSHGTYYGPWQISDKWLPELSKWGYDAHALQHSACANAVAGAYVLAYYFIREQNWPDAIARFNVGSINTPARLEAGSRYARKVIQHWRDIYYKWNK